MQSSLFSEKHKVIPVFKSDDCSSVKCYRLISLLSNTSKVLECLKLYLKLQILLGLSSLAF